ncbi:MAG: hypothetical protein JWN67_808 [Actinomycetia bacterium]|nr:hypothetical protein [Actinomycetes bacterium]
MDDMEITADVLLADYAAVADGKLTLVGAGFDWFSVPGPPTFGVGILVHVPWNETNNPHRWRLRLVDADGQPFRAPDGSVVEVGDRFELGRPSGVPAGAPLTLPLACNLQGLAFTTAGRWIVQLLLDDRANPIGDAGFTVLG